MATLGNYTQAFQGSSDETEVFAPVNTIGSPTSSKNLTTEFSPSPSAAVYPSPLATHSEVIADRDLFYDTLNKFHAALGTRLM